MASKTRQKERRDLKRMEGALGSAKHRRYRVDYGGLFEGKSRYFDNLSNAKEFAREANKSTGYAAIHLNSGAGGNERPGQSIRQGYRY